MPRIATIFSLCLLAFGCLLFSWPTVAAEPTPLVLQLRWQHQYQFAGYYVADQLGFYRDAGLDVEIRAGDRAVTPVDEVVSGRAAFGVEGSSLLLARASGKPVKALAAIFQKSPLRLIARADSGIRRISDLAGRKVMLLPGQRSLALIAMLDQVGLMDKITRVDTTGDVGDLIDGKVDAFNGYVSNEPYLLAQAGVPITLFDPAAYGIQFYSDVLFTRDDLADEKPQLVAAFRAATLRGWQYALEHPEQTVEMVHQFYAPDRSLAQLRFEANGLQDSIMPDVVELGHMSDLRWNKTRQQLVSLGLIAPDATLKGFLFNEKPSIFGWQTAEPLIIGAVLVLALLLAVTAVILRKNLRLQDEVELRLAAENHARHQATHDYLTGLPNRMLLLDRLQGALARARRHRHTPLVGFIDLDNFKTLNDRCGHERGDELLCSFAKLVLSCIREEDTFARIGGDEFVLLIDNISGTSVEHEAERLMRALAHVTETMHCEVKVTASIGLLHIKDATDLSIEDVLRLADDLMYQVKRMTKNGYRTATIPSQDSTSSKQAPSAPQAEIKDATG